MVTKSYLKDLTYQINGATIEVHKNLGPGLLESVYHKCLLKELSLRNVNCISEHKVLLDYKGTGIEVELRCDIFVENLIVVELKSIEALAPVHEAQLLTYMRLLKAPKGILFNFNVVNLYKEGQKTFVNEIFKELPE